MAGKKFTQGSEEWQFFKDFYLFCQKYWIAEKSSEYWDGLTREAGELNRKYRDGFAKKLILAFLECLEEKERSLR